MTTQGPTSTGDKDLWGNPKPRVSPDRTGPGSGNILKNIFGSGRVGNFFRAGEFYFGRSGSGYFFTGV